MKFSNLTSNQKKWGTRGIITFVILALAIPLYKSRDRNRKDVRQSKEQIVDLDKHTFEDSILAQTQAEIRELRSSIDDFKEDYLKKLDVISSESQKDLKRYKSSLEKTAKKAAVSQNTKEKEEIIREVIRKTGGEKRQDKQGGIFTQKAEAADRATGQNGSVAQKKHFGIKVSKPEAVDKRQQTKQNQKTAKDKNTVYMPPGFTEASLLSGVVASTSGAAANQVPMIIRIKNLAVLPNEFQQDIKGCFVIANGEGNLAQERVLGRLATLSCISKDGQSIIDQSVKGWIIDKDGRAGMRGKVVAKFGAHMLRVALAGALDGFGSALSETANVTYSGAYGTSTQLKDTDLSTVTQAGLGGSLSSVAEDLSDFYLNLASQTLPVIEVGPTKDITIAFQEGVELEIKKRI